jgi:uncharacterized OB-fold protein
MIRMEPYVKNWYDYLDAGKIMGLRCKRCGAYEFPPVPICNSCSSTDLEWVEMSGSGSMLSITTILMVDPPFASFGPRVCGHVHMAEGPDFISWIEGVGLEQQFELYDRLPIEVQAEIQQRNGYKYPVFRIKE